VRDFLLQYIYISTSLIYDHLINQTKTTSQLQTVGGTVVEIASNMSIAAKQDETIVDG
jgi:hypothetical protein